MFKKSVIAVCGILLLAGCAQREIVVSQNIAQVPDVAIKENIQLDFDQVRSDLEEIMISDDYPLVSYIDFAVYEDRNIIRLILPLKEEATQLDSLSYAQSYIKIFNDVAATQDFSIAKSADGYYGGLWDRYNMELEVYKESDIMYPELYYVNQAMDAGANDSVVPQIIEETESTEAAQ